MIEAIDTSSGKPNFKLVADIDFLSFLLCHRATLLPQSTQVWLVAHSIEKYLKAILEKNGQSLSGGHNIDKLWKRAIQFIDKSELFDSFIKKINSLQPNVRYLEKSITYNRDFAGFYLALATHLRYIILGEEEYHKRDYGLEKDLIMGDKAPLNMIKENLKVLFENKISFSPIGIPDKISVDLPHLIQKDNKTLDDE